MQLINTIEITPYSYSDIEYDFPQSSSAESPDEWNQFWKKCIAHKNLGHLESIRKGAYLVDITTLQDDDLVEIVKKELNDVDLPDFEEQVIQISGGIALQHNDVLYIEPSCCGDMGNIKGWEDILKNESTTWTELWIGHPWVYYRRNNERVEFSEYTESTPKDLSAMEVLVSVPLAELQHELRKVRQQQNDLEVRIQKTLEKMGIVPAERIAKLMTG
jgi:hypothetical protein